MSEGLYKDVLMDHYRNPRNRGELDDADVVCRGSNPRCGDDIEVGVRFDGDCLAQVGFRGRGCAICLGLDDDGGSHRHRPGQGAGDV